MNDLARKKEWDDPSHWRMGVLYSAPNDSRLLVPLRFANAGWTPNLARPRAVVLGVGLLATAVAPFIAAAAMYRLQSPLVFGGALIWFLAVFIPISVLTRGDGD
jgi:hypothetical protein